MICVDWKRYSTDLSYAVATMRAKHIGHDIAQVLTRITYNLTKGVENIHLIGHSMGAHIAGFVGKNLVDKIPRITGKYLRSIFIVRFIFFNNYNIQMFKKKCISSGLDPAKPRYEDNDPVDRLCDTDAYFVDVMHTNSAKNGFKKSIGHIDFFPNGGKSQPNCKFSDKCNVFEIRGP